MLRGKLETRTEKCLFMGYCPNGYRLWNPDKSQIVFGHEVIFDENKFEHEASVTKNWLPRNEDIGKVATELSKNITKNDETENEGGVTTEHERNEESTSSELLQRSTREKMTPKYLDYAILALNAQTYVEDVPDSFDDVDSSQNKEDWKEAVERELRSLMQNGTWTLVNKPYECKVIDCKWIFKVKRDANGKIDKFKTRLVTKGCAQEKGYDYDETYAPVARVTTLKILLSLIVENDLYACQLDVENAFLHGDLHETGYMGVPKGVKANYKQVCKLNKTLYGLKQAPRE